MSGRGDQPGSLPWPQRLLPWLALVRLPAVVSVWSNILAAHWLATGGAPQPGALLLQMLASTCLYWAGMVLNDCFDLAIDRRERPERPLPAGQIPVRAAWLVGFGLLGLALLPAAALANLAGPAPLVIAVALAVAVLAYDGGLKHRPVGALVMGLCRYLNWLLGLAVVPIAGSAWLLPLPILGYTTAVTVLAGAETRDGDRATVVAAGLLLGLTAVALLALHLTGVLTDPVALGLTALAAGLLLRRLAWLAGPTAGGPPALAVRAAVGLLLLGMIPLDALLLAGAGHWWAAGALLLLLLPGRLFARWISMT